MLNIGGIFGSMGRILPGYVQGERQAIADNWQDLNQYNQVQSGQIRNAFDELTFPLAYNMYADQAGISRAAALQAGMNLGTRLLGAPGEFQTALYESMLGPELTKLRGQDAMNQLTNLNPFIRGLYMQYLQQMQGGGTGAVTGKTEANMRTGTPPTAG